MSGAPRATLTWMVFVWLRFPSASTAVAPIVYVPSTTAATAQSKSHVPSLLFVTPEVTSTPLTENFMSAAPLAAAVKVWSVCVLSVIV